MLGYRALNDEPLNSERKKYQPLGSEDSILRQFQASPTSPLFPHPEDFEDDSDDEEEDKDSDSEEVKVEVGIPVCALIISTFTLHSGQHHCLCSAKTSVKRRADFCTSSPVPGREGCSINDSCHLRFPGRFFLVGPGQCLIVKSEAVH